MSEKDLSAVQIKSKHVSTSVLAFQNTGMLYPGDDNRAVELTARLEAIRVKEFLDHNTNGMFRAAFNELFMHEVFVASIRACPQEFYMKVEAETGQEVLCLLRDHSVLLRGPKVMEPVNKSITNGNTTSNENNELVEEPIKHDTKSKIQEDDWEPSHPYRPSYPSGRDDKRVARHPYSSGE